MTASPGKKNRNRHQQGKDPNHDLTSHPSSLNQPFSLAKSQSGIHGASVARLDKYLWAIRIFRTRSLAGDACRASQVKRDSMTLKAAYQVKPGDILDVVKGPQRLKIEVVSVIEKRVAAPLAQKHYIDHTPPPVETEPTARRDRGLGRPTKKDRRDWEEVFEAE
ncbi:MAG: RNA-binding S4 domain-containing protein [Verrucomicrobiota bacterium]